MTIDWITVSAQIINFLILVWLLKRFLYRPVIDSMERRERQFAERVEDAGTRENQANLQRQHFLDAERDLERNHDQLLDQAREDAARYKKELLGEAREEVADARDQWQNQIHAEKAQFLESLRFRATQTVQSMASQALAEMADADLEAQMIRSFVRRLVDLDEHERKSINARAEPIRILTTFEMDRATKDRLTDAVRTNLDDAINVQFETSQKLLCGIELSIGGYKLSWSLADYFDRVANHVGDVFDTSKSRRA